MTLDLSKFKTLEELEAEFSYGEIPDDESDTLAKGGDEIDAVNDETFGGGGFDDHELEDYAAQTASLRLEDNWDSRPGCSADAPDASALPMPSFGSLESAWPETTSNTDRWTTSNSNGLYNIWGNTSSTTWDMKPSAEMTFTPTVQDATIRRPTESKPASKQLPPMPSAVPTLEELERGMMPSSQPHHMQTPKQPIGAMTADELERRMLEETSKRAFMSSPHAPSPAGQPQMPNYGMSSGLMPPAGVPGMPGMPQMPPSGMPGVPPMLPPLPPIPPAAFQFMPVWLEFLAGRIPYLPNGFPPVPQLLLMMKKMNDPRLAHMIAMGPPPSMPPQNNWQQRQRKPPGMPSGKTIEDFAMEPFAGFMSCKERKWLVKIQILQCAQGTGDPFEDDFYFTCWREKRLAEGWKPKEVTANKENEDLRSLNDDLDRRKDRKGRRDKDDDDRRDREYVPPKFTGSLGKPVSSTTSNPRHLIDVSSSAEGGDRPATQKKFRTLLIRLESAVSLVMKCEDARRQMRMAPHLCDKLEAQVTEWVSLLLKELVEGDQFARTVQIGKGRALVGRVLRVANAQQQITAANTIMRALTSMNKKQHAELSSDLLPTIYNVQAEWIRDLLLAFIAGLDMADIQQALVDKNAVVAEALLFILCCCAMRKASSSTGVFRWLRGPVSGEVDWPACLQLRRWQAISRVDDNAVRVLCEWLGLLSPDARASTPARQLATALLAQL